ncbi:MAG TPA: GNAT family N-acetyltransferase [Candidatus Eisenbacteria bacterium]|nr:GNAT family N-acetyltransferase [Candidatus Eisenbacteria bacterium]
MIGGANADPPVERRPRALPDGVVLRLATPDDLPACEAVYRAALNGYLGPLGFPEIPTENPGLRRLHAHTLATDPTRFWLAARGDQVVAFGSAVVRGPVWFLSMLFVDPAEQARGLGRALLQQLLPASADGPILATATDSAQPISNGLYASLGIVPRLPLLNLVGRPREDHDLPPLPPGIRVEPIGGQASDAAAIAALDRAVLGFEHPEELAFLGRDGRVGFAFRDREGTLQGYGYASEAGRVGPLGVADPTLLGPALGHLLTAVQPRGASSVWLPGSATDAIVVALRAGLRIESFPVLLCWNRPFADFARYLPISPGLL